MNLMHSFQAVLLPTGRVTIYAMDINGDMWKCHDSNPASEGTLTDWVSSNFVEPIETPEAGGSNDPA